MSDADRDLKLRKILNAIVKLAAGDYRIELPFSESDDPMDWIASGLNMLSAELKRTVVSRNHFNAILSSMPDSLIVLNQMGFIELANESTERLLGVEKNLLNGLHFSRICPGFFKQGSIHYGKLSEHGLDEPLEIEYLGRGNVAVPVLFSASALSEASASGRGWVCSAQDLRSRKALEATLRQQETLLAHSSKLAALGEMAAGIAHEINNPIAIVSGRADQIREMAESGKIDAGEIIKMADRIDATARRVSKIITGLRTFARDAEGDPFQDTQVAELIDETIALCSERFKNNGVELRIDPIDPTLHFECRSVQISQVLLNLLNNAFDAISNQKEKWVRVRIDQDSDMIRMNVIDSGPGIPKEMRDKVMQPFFTTKEPGKGTGLGLSIASSILTAHKGRLIIDDAQTNTAFVILLPISQAKSLSSAVSKAG